MLVLLVKGKERYDVNVTLAYAEEKKEEKEKDLSSGLLRKGEAEKIARRKKG